MQATGMPTMKIIHSLTNIFNVLSYSGSIDLDTKLKELSNQVGCLQRAHANSLGQLWELRRELRTELSSILQKLGYPYVMRKEAHHDIEAMLAKLVDANGICKMCGLDHSFQPDFEGLETRMDDTPELFRKRLFNV